MLCFSGLLYFVFVIFPLIVIRKLKTNWYFYLPFSCHSPVGHHRGRGLVSLGHGCERKGTAMHEFLHVLGFWHEQNRYDRDKYVTINLSNVKTSTFFKDHIKLLIKTVILITVGQQIQQPLNVILCRWNWIWIELHKYTRLHRAYVYWQRNFNVYYNWIRGERTHQLLYCRVFDHITQHHQWYWLNMLCFITTTTHTYILSDLSYTKYTNLRSKVIVEMSTNFKAMLTQNHCYLIFKRCLRQSALYNRTLL